MLSKIQYGLYRAKYMFGPKLNLKKPVDVSLELSSLCNMACGYCYHADPKHLPFKKGLMDWDTADTIVRESAVLGVHSLKFNWKGESTLNPIFPRITALAKKLAHGSTFIDRLTNSNFKFPTNNDEIFEGLCHQTKVKVSYDSFRKEVFEGQRLQGNHDITTANIDKFYNYPGRNNILVIQAVRTKLNKDEDIAGLAKKRWPEALISIRDMVGGRVEKDVSSYEDKERGVERQTCIQAHVRIIFNHAGVAFPCCPDVGEKLKIGDIKSQTVEDIFNSAEAKLLRSELKSGSAFDLDPCKKCSSFESYKGFKPVWNS